MLASDAVVVYQFFGLNVEAIFALVRIVVTTIIIIFTVRIPFKRNYHWMFLVASAVLLWHGVFYFLTQIAPNPALGETLLRINNFAYTNLQALVIFQFVVYFVSRTVRPWEKITLAAGYAFLIVFVWVPLIIDPSLLGDPRIHLTVFGWANGLPGVLQRTFRPDGFDFFTTIIGILTFFLLFRYYRSQKSGLVREQTGIMIIGMFFFFAGFYANYISLFSYGTIPNTLDIIAGFGDLILLLGLRRKGFYSVTPTAETATTTEPIKYPLLEGRSYLANDPRAAFESFSELARSGREGLLITRTFPTDVRTEYGLQTTPIRWLAESKSQEAIAPEDLLGISLMVKDFLEKSKKPVVMLHGLEYLATYNGFTPILRLIQGLKEETATRRGILILPVVPQGLDKHEEALLSLETTPMPAKL